MEQMEVSRREEAREGAKCRRRVKGRKEGGDDAGKLEGNRLQNDPRESWDRPREILLRLLLH
eukprot:3107414-Rhodomonas_salina.2